MTINKFAEMLNGREYGAELSKEDEKLADDLGFIVVIGCSDDLIELYGAMREEGDVYNGGTVHLTKEGLCFDDYDDARGCADGRKICPYAERCANGTINKKCSSITAVWCPDDLNCSWKYETDIPHATFDIFEDGELYCRGIVFEANSLVGYEESTPPLMPGDIVQMNDKYHVSEKNRGINFTVRSKPYDCCGTLCVLLEGYSGCYAVDGLTKVK